MKALAISDRHFPDGRASAVMQWRWFEEVAAPFEPDWIFSVGDNAEAFYCRTDDALKALIALFEKARETCPGAQLAAVGGNHSRYLYRQHRDEIAKHVNILAPQGALVGPCYLIHGDQWDNASFVYDMLIRLGYRGWRRAGAVAERFKTTGSRQYDKSHYRRKAETAAVVQDLRAHNILIYGHTHVPRMHVASTGTVCVDIGSGVEGPWQEYLVIEDRIVTLRRYFGDRDIALAQRRLAVAP